MLAHVLDCATLESGRDPVTDFDIIEAELAAYGVLDETPRVVVLNKVDIPEAADLAELAAEEFQARGYDVFEVSAVSHAGLRPLTFALAARVRAARDAAAAEAPARPRVTVRPVAVDDSGFSVVPLAGGAFRWGTRPTRWVRQTDFSNDEAVAYLAERLRRLGVEDELRRLGAVPGCEVLIGPPDDSVVFDWEPTADLADELAADAEPDAGPERPTAVTFVEVIDDPCRRMRRASGDAPPEIVEAERIVVKVGSSSLTTSDGVLDVERLHALVDVLAERVVGSSRQIVLVTSGAVAAGIGPLGLPGRPRALATQQAAASVGRGLLLAHYATRFRQHGITVGQVLLTSADLTRRAHYSNARHTPRVPAVLRRGADRQRERHRRDAPAWRQ